MAIEKAATPTADDGQTEWDQERRIVAALDELDMWEQERTGLRLWLQGRLRKAVYERAGYAHYDDATSVSLHQILVDEWKPMELAFGERLQGWQDVFDALPHVEKDYRKEAEDKARHQWYTAAQAARTAAAQQQEETGTATDELAEARAAREREQQQRQQQQQQREVEEYQRWGEVVQQAVDAAGALIVETMRAAGWEVVGEDPVDTRREVISGTFYPGFLGRALQFQAPGDSGNWLGELYFHPYSRAKETAERAGEEIAEPTGEPTGEPAEEGKEGEEGILIGPLDLDLWPDL